MGSNGPSCPLSRRGRRDRGRGESSPSSSSRIPQRPPLSLPSSWRASSSLLIRILQHLPPSFPLIQLFHRLCSVSSPPSQLNSALRPPSSPALPRLVPSSILRVNPPIHSSSSNHSIYTPRSFELRCFTLPETTPSPSLDETFSSPWTGSTVVLPLELPTSSSIHNNNILISSRNLILSTIHISTREGSSSGRTDQPSRTTSISTSSTSSEAEDTGGQHQTSIHPPSRTE